MIFASLLLLLPMLVAGDQCGSGLVNDPFDCGIDCVWTQVNTGGMDIVDDGKLMLYVGEGVEADFWTKPAQLANVPRIYQKVWNNGDFDIKVYLDTGAPPDVTEKFNDMGVFLRFGADDQFHRLSVFTDGSGGDYNWFYAKITGGSVDGPSTNLSGKGFPSYIRVHRVGGTVDAYYGGDLFKTFSVPEGIDGVGVFAANGGTAGNTPNFAGSFDSFEVLCDGEDPAPTVECNGGSSSSCVGDPHFKTWSKEGTENWFDFHGICDLVLMQSEGFGNGLGMNVHIRTKPRYEYSYIEAATVQIGEDVLEVGSYGEFWFNGVQGSAMPNIIMGGRFPVTYTQLNKKMHRFEIHLDDLKKEKVVVFTHKDIVAVTVENASRDNFDSSYGMMGRFVDGALVSRDGNTLMSDDLNAFGQEWQVLPSEPQLFQAPSPFLGQACVPSTLKKTGRRLGEASIQKEAAEMACAQYDDETKKDMCIFDVIAMEDLDVADVHGAY